MLKEKTAAVFQKLKELLKKFINGVKEKQKAPIALLVSVSLVLIFGLAALGTYALPQKSEEPFDSETETETDSETETETETESESVSVVESTSETETETESESETETETESETDTTATQQTTQAQTPSDNNEDVDIGWGNITQNPGSSSSGTSSSPLGSDETGGRVHTTADAPINEYEDNSETIPYQPLKKSYTPDYNAPYNIPQLRQDDMKPGVLLKGDADYSSTLIGYDGFLFCQDSFADYDGTSLFHSAKLEVIVNNMVKRNEWVEQLDAKSNSVDGKKKMYFLFVPNKNSVYDDYMPENYTMGSYRRIDQVINALKAAGLNIIDGRESIRAAKAENPQRSLYYKTDTHWNNHGAFYAYQQLMTEIKKDFPDVVIHNRSDYQINYCETFMKDQAYYLGYYDTTSEIGPVYTLKSGKTASFAGSQHKDRWGQFEFSYQWDNGYSDHLYWYKWRNNYNSGAPSMYMLRDSYSIALNSFLKDSFYESTYNWSFRFNKSEILSSNADVIIIEVVEKNLADCMNQMPFS